jgi:hypothetical protein
VTCGSLRSSAAIFSARSRGFEPASLASTMAALVARSPWLASRGSSTTMRERSGGAEKAPALVSVATAAPTCSVKTWKTFMPRPDSKSISDTRCTWLTFRCRRSECAAGHSAAFRATARPSEYGLLSMNYSRAANRIFTRSPVASMASFARSTWTGRAMQTDRSLPWWNTAHDSRVAGADASAFGACAEHDLRVTVLSSTEAA